MNKNELEAMGVRIEISRRIAEDLHHRIGECRDTDRWAAPNWGEVYLALAIMKYTIVKAGNLPMDKALEIEACLWR